jgi:hypothetical protein
VTLVEPNAQKLIRAERSLAEALPRATTRIRSMAEGLGTGRIQLSPAPTVVTVASVLMPAIELRGGTQRAAISWLDTALAELAAMVAPGGHLLILETLGAPWARGGLDEPARRLSLPEFGERLAHAGLSNIECTYRFRDRVVLVIRREPK